MAEGSDRGHRLMFNVCRSCGLYRVDKIIDEENNLAVCPDCGHPHPFVRIPLYVVTGASGTGKSAVCAELAEQTKDYVVLDSDILWGICGVPEDGFRAYREMWLRMCKNIHQGGRSVILCGSVNVGDFERCVEARYFSHIKYISLVCPEEEHVRRLKARPVWRSSGSEEFVGMHLAYNAYFKKLGGEGLPVIDTTVGTPADTAAKILSWVRKGGA